MAESSADLYFGVLGALASLDFNEGTLKPYISSAIYPIVDVLFLKRRPFSSSVFYLLVSRL